MGCGASAPISPLEPQGPGPATAPQAPVAAAQAPQAAPQAPQAAPQAEAEPGVDSGPAFAAEPPGPAQPIAAETPLSISLLQRLAAVTGGSSTGLIPAAAGRVPADAGTAGGASGGGGGGGGGGHPPLHPASAAAKIPTPPIKRGSASNSPSDSPQLSRAGTRRKSIHASALNMVRQVGSFSRRQLSTLLAPATWAPRSQEERTTARSLGAALLRRVLGTHTAAIQKEEAATEVVDVKKEVKVKDEKGVKRVNQYVMMEVLGRGATGKVRKCFDETRKVHLAVKIIRKSLMKRRRVGRFGNALQDVVREIAVWKKLRHPYVVRLSEVIDDEASDKLYMFGEYVDGGHIMPDATTAEPLPLAKARRYFCMLIDGLYYLHFNDVVHRDIKPGNLLIDTRTDSVKITDFGVSQVIATEGDSFRNTAGTAAFLSPEMLSGQTFSAKMQDVWACGITLYMFLYGTTPFVGATVSETYERIKSGKVRWPSVTATGKPLAASLAEHAIANDLIQRLLDPNPETRMTLEEARVHPFLAPESASLNDAPAERVVVDDAEVAAAVSSVVRLRAMVKAAVVGKRSLNAARLRIALRSAAAFKEAAERAAARGEALPPNFEADEAAQTAALLDSPPEHHGGFSLSERSVSDSSLSLPADSVRSIGIDKFVGLGEGHGIDEGPRSRTPPDSASDVESYEEEVSSQASQASSTRNHDPSLLTTQSEASHSRKSDAAAVEFVVVEQ